jgi:hypothetical protein
MNGWQEPNLDVTTTTDSANPLVFLKERIGAQIATVAVTPAGQTRGRFVRLEFFQDTIWAIAHHESS